MGCKMKYELVFSEEFDEGFLQMHGDTANSSKVHCEENGFNTIINT